MTLKTILLSFSVSALLCQPLQAEVNAPHAMNVLKGTYKLTDEFSGIPVTFAVDNKGKIQLQENDAFYKAKAIVNALGNDVGPEGLSIMTIMLSGGSDEQTDTLHIRLYPKQDEHTVATLLDVVFTENDGPNHLSFIERQSNAHLYKQDKSGRFVEVKRQ